MATTYSPSRLRAGAAPSVTYDSILLIGRIVLVLMFVFSGASKFADISATAASIAGKGLPAATVLAILVATVEVVGGLMIAVGWQTRLAAIGLIGFTLVATYFFHDFWNMTGDARHGNMIHAMKNLSVVGAFLMLFASGPGAYALDHPRA
jgi:putative oxidoreductase